MTQKTSETHWIVWDTRNGTLVRVVEGPEYMVTMAGQWCSSYSICGWGHILKLLNATKEKQDESLLK